MLASQDHTTLPTPEGREALVQELTERLLPLAEQAARRMAEALAELPDDQLFGAIEHTLRDQAHRLATDAHQAAVAAKKRGT